LDLFGSHAKGIENAGSDVDLLVEYEQGNVPGLLGLLSFEEDLSAIFDGRKIDLVSKGDSALICGRRSWTPGALFMSDDLAFLLHIRDALREVRTFVEGETYESFLQNRMLQNAVMRYFEVVGEAARRVSSGFREANPEVPWQLIGDFRNKLIHGYSSLDLEVIRNTATDDAPMLLSRIEGLVDDE